MTDTDPRCESCGHPRSKHHYRHPFVGPSEPDTIAMLTAKLAEWQASQHYTYIGKDGKPVLARDLEARAEAAEAKVAEVENQLDSSLHSIRVLEGRAQQFLDRATDYDALAAKLADVEAQLVSGSFYQEKDIDALQARAEAAEAALATARRDALEEAAKICEAASVGVTHYGPEPYQICAAHIRARTTEGKDNE